MSGENNRILNIKIKLKMKKLIGEKVDFTCVIKYWKSKGYFGETIYFQTIHPKL